MLKNDKANMVIALLIAIALWVYVLGGDPTATSIVRGIPITFMGQSALAEEGYILLSSSDEAISATISGQRSDVNRVKRGDKIKVIADLEGLQEGEHSVRLKITTPDSVEISDTSKNKVTVVIDRLVSVEKPVVATLTGQSSDESEPYIVQLSREKVAVSGAATLVDQVSALNAELDSAKVDSTLKAFNVKLNPVDKDGRIVEGVTLENKTVSITAVLLNKKTVKLNVPLVGQDTGNAERTVQVPKTITIKGTDADLSDISYINAEPLDLSTVFEDTTLPIVPILPDGIEVATNSVNLTAEVMVKGMESVEFVYRPEAIVLEGVTEDTIVTVGEVKLVLKVTGKADVIDALAADDFYFTADVSGLEPGKHTVKLKCQCDAKIGEVEFSPHEVEVTITLRNEEQEEE